MTLRHALLAALMGCIVSLANGAELSVLSGGAIEPGLKPVVEAFQAATGHTVRVTFNPAPQITSRIEAGEAWDVVIAPAAALDAFARGAKVGTERAPVGRVGLGVAVRPGAPLPEIGDAEGVKRSILEADSIVFNRASTGLVVEAMLRKMGIDQQVAARTTRYPDGASVMEHLLRGTGREVGFGAITEILLFKDRGLRLVGPLPPGLQVETTYVGALPNAGSRSDAARLLLTHLQSPDSLQRFAGAGIDAPR
ncbi:MAG: substrate-binding domain-containing protein [Caldimonas sp.]